MAFLLKKWLGSLLMPLPFGFVLLAIAALCWWRGRQTLARALVIAVILLWFALSLTPVANRIVAPLEFAYPPYAGQAVDAVVVLGGYHRTDPRIPASSVLSATSMNRLIEGLVILRQHPQAVLALGGYAGNDVVSNARAMADTAELLGVEAQRMLIAEAPRDTREEAQHWAKVLAGKRVALVTSATHMARSVRLFNAAGLSVIAAPTRYLAAGSQDYSWRAWVPDAHNIDKVEQAWHEYLGLLWATLTE